MEVSKGVKRQLIRNVFLAIFGIWLVLGLIWTANKVTIIDLLLTCLPQQEIANSPYILVIGIDATDGAKRSDTIMLFKIHNSTNKVNIISIPRDSYVAIPGHGYSKINHAYAYGGSDLLIRTVEHNFNIDIYKHIQVSLEDLKYIVGVLGGVEVDVDVRMYYQDKAGNLFINLQPGKQRLNSEQAMGFIRFRHDIDGDIGRTRRQQILIQAIFSEVSRPINMFKIPVIMTHLLKQINTDLNIRELLWFSSKVKKSYDNSQLFRTTLTGTDLYIWGVSFINLDQDMLRTVLLKAQDPTEIKQQAQTTRVIATQQTSGPPQPASIREPESSDKTHISAPVLEPIRMEILNGNGVEGSAEQVKDELLKKGFVISRLSNSSRFTYRKSTLVIWHKKGKDTNYVRKLLGINRRQVKISDKGKRIYATLVLGKDWEKVINNIRMDNSIRK